jgi:hypothetical protein
MPKAPKSPGGQQRHNPLAEEYAPSDPWKQKAAKRQKRTKDDKDDEQKFVDSKSSRKILDIGRELEEEDERENQARSQKGANNPAFDFETRMGEDDVVEQEEVPTLDDDDEAWGEDDDDVEEVEIDANDLAAWNKFIPTDENPIVWPGQEAQPSGQGTDLAALILEKIAAHEATDGAVKQPQIMGGGAPEDAVELPAKVVEGTAYSLSRLVSLLRLSSVLQGWPHHEPLQVRQAPKALQDSTRTPCLGDTPVHHTPRELDTQCHVRRNPHLHLRKTTDSTDLPQHRPPSSRTGSHPRNTQAECAFVQCAQESLVQAQCLLQRRCVPHAH